jgi:hypothetical protein
MPLRESSSTLLTKAAIFVGLGGAFLVWSVLIDTGKPSFASLAPLLACVVAAFMVHGFLSDARWIRRAPTVTVKLADAAVDLSLSFPAGCSIVGFHPYASVYLSCRNVAVLAPTGEQLAFVEVWREPWTIKFPQWFPVPSCFQGLRVGPRRPLARLDPVTVKIGKSKLDRQLIVRLTPRPPSPEKLQDAEIGVIIK